MRQGLIEGVMPEVSGATVSLHPPLAATPPGQPQRFRRSHRFCHPARIGSYAAIALALMLVGAPAAKAQQPAAPTVGVVKADKRPVTEAVRFVGRIEATQRVEVRARVTGYLENILFKDGERVKAGTPLYQIEKGPFQAAVQQAQAGVLRMQAQLDNAITQTQRAEELLKTSATSVAVRDDRLTAQKTAQGNLNGAQADLKTAEINLDYTEIRSPIDGRIGRTAVTRGNVVGPNSGVLTTIVSVDPMYVVFPVSQREFLRLAEERGKHQASADHFKVVVQFSNGTIYKQTGKIDFVDVKVDPSTDSITVRATLQNPDGELVDGQLVQVSVEGDKPEERVVIPQAALIADQQGVYVFAVEDGKAAVKRLKLGPTKGGSVVVLEGLSGGEMVVVQGAQTLRPGLPVTAAPIQSSVRGF
jgi:membrane fusion protein (multidrug efflux system)